MVEDYIDYVWSSDRNKQMKILQMLPCSCPLGKKCRYRNSRRMIRLGKNIINYQGYVSKKKTVAKFFREKLDEIEGYRAIRHKNGSIEIGCKKIPRLIVREVRKWALAK